MTDYHGLTKFTPGNAVAALELERRVRADERRRCMTELEELAVEYVYRWAKIIGEDRAKACAFDIVSCARRLRSQSDSSAEHTK